MTAALKASPVLHARTRARRFTIVDEPILIGRCDSCHGEELVLRVVRDETDPTDVAIFDLCRGCAPRT